MPEENSSNHRSRGSRPTYEEYTGVERYIVPLLNNAITECLGSLPRPSEGAAALDVGCGSQPFRGLLEDLLGYNYFSLDTEGGGQREIDFIAPIDAELPAEVKEAAPGGYALILCTEVLEHVAEWENAYKNLSSLLAPGGKLIITTPHFYIPHEEPYDYWRPTDHSHAYWGEKNDLKILKRERLGNGWDVLGTFLESTHTWRRNHQPQSFLVGGLVVLMMSTLRALLRSGLCQNAADTSAPFYLSLLLVMEKSGEEQ